MKHVEWYFTKKLGFVAWEDAEGWIAYFFPSLSELEKICERHCLVVDPDLAPHLNRLPQTSDNVAVSYRGQTAHAMQDFIMRAARFEERVLGTMRVAVPQPFIVSTAIFKDEGISEGFMARVDKKGVHHFEIFFSQAQALTLIKKIDWPPGRLDARHAFNSIIMADTHLANQTGQPLVELPPNVAQWLNTAILVTQEETRQRAHLN